MWLIPSATRGRARLPVCLSRFHVVEIRRLLFRSPSRDGDSTLSDLDTVLVELLRSPQIIYRCEISKLFDMLTINVLQA